MSIFFTSDQHYYHTNIIKFCNRPFATVEEMNEKMVYNWNSIVKPEDSVYCLGDFSMAFRSVELFSSRLMGKKFLIPGNHDFCHSVHKKSRHPENQKKWIKEYEKNGWIVLPEQMKFDIDGITVNLCHMPYIEDHTGEVRYEKNRPVDDGNWLLHGHIHEKWKIKNKMINVGVDIWDFKPVSLDQIKEIIND